MGRAVHLYKLIHLFFFNKKLLLLIAALENPYNLFSPGQSFQDGHKPFKVRGRGFDSICHEVYQLGCLGTVGVHGVADKFSYLVNEETSCNHLIVKLLGGLSDGGNER